MKSILYKLLQKRGIDNIDQLDKEEKQIFDNWNAVLSKDELTLEDVKEFCKSQCQIIESKWADYETTNAKKAEMIPYHTVYKTLLQVIDSPRSARENLEKHLQQLLNN